MGGPSTDDKLRAELKRLEAQRADLLDRIDQMRFERDGYYGEWRHAKNQLDGLRRSPAWPVWLVWRIIRKVLLFPCRIFGLVPRFVGWVYLNYWIAVARLEAGRQEVGDEIPPPQVEPRGPTSAVRPKPKVLIVSPYSIYPPHHGGAVRLYNLIKQLKDRCYLYLLIFNQGGEDAEQRKALEPLCQRVDFHHWVPDPRPDPFGQVPPSALLFSSRIAADKIRDIVLGFDIDLVQLEYTELGQYIESVPPGVPVVLTEHDVAYRSFERKRELGFQRRFPEGSAYGASRLDLKRLLKYEVSCVRNAGQIHTMSEDDAFFLAPFLDDGETRFRVLPNGVDGSFYAPPENLGPRRDVLYVGNFQNLANVDALQYFVADVWPLIRLEHPEAKLSVVGANTSDRVTRFDGLDGITVIGEVDDLRPAYHHHRVMVAPIRAGSGTRLKIFEACAAGLPVVSTTLGAEGIEYEDGTHLLIADSAVEFADAVNRVLTDDALADRLSRAGLELVQQKYDWMRIAGRLRDCYHELTWQRLVMKDVDKTDEPEVLEPMIGPHEIGRPDVSVLIPTLNGGDDLARCLESIRAQQTDLDVEIVCVDSGSPDEDLEVMKRHRVRIVRINKKTFNHGLSRDLAARHAKSGLLVFLNQDAIPADDQWLRRIVEPLRSGEDDVAAVQGGIREVDDLADRFFWDSCGELFYFTRESSRWLDEYRGIGFSTVNCAIKRSTWNRHRFGWATIMEDKKWQREVVDMGYRIVDCPKATVIHTHNYDRRSLIRRCVSEGYGWRTLGIRYSLWDAVRDMMKPRVYRRLLGGLARKQVRTSAELFFPWIRPIALYYGNRHALHVML